MACRLTGAKPFLNQCWIIVNRTLRNKFQRNLNRNSNIFIRENAFESVVCETAAILSLNVLITLTTDLKSNDTAENALHHMTSSRGIEFLSDICRYVTPLIPDRCPDGHVDCFSRRFITVLHSKYWEISQDCHVHRIGADGFSVF